MRLLKYLQEYPLKRDTYTRADVEKIRKHAFQVACDVPGPISGKQRRYYFAVIVEMLSLETGYTKEEMHKHVLGEMFRLCESNGQVFVRSITDYKAPEMEDYMSGVRMWASQELHMYIPLPNETEFAYTIKEKINAKTDKDPVGSGDGKVEKQNTGQ
jgi:hypothetical protein